MFRSLATDFDPSRTRKQKNRVHVVQFWFDLELLQLDSHRAELELFS